MPLRHKRKDTTGYTWTGSDLVSGQLGVNEFDGSLHIKKSVAGGGDYVEFQNTEENDLKYVAHLIIHNDTGVTINKGQVVSLDPTTVVSGNVTCDLALSAAPLTTDFIYVAIEDISNGTTGRVTKQDKITDIDTSAFSVGDRLWLSDTTAGGLTATRPAWPSYQVEIGDVLTVNATTGSIDVFINAKLTDTVLNFFNGSIRERFDFLVTSNGTTITGTLTPADYTGDLTLMFSDGFTIIDTDPGATVTLTAGTDPDPVTNYVYIPKSTKVLAVSTSDWPATEHVRVAQVVCGSAASVQNDGLFANQNINDPIVGADGGSHLYHITERIRRLRPDWLSGCTPSISIDTVPSPDDVTFSITSGEVYQMHPQTVVAKDMATGTPAYVTNEPGTTFNKINDLNELTVDSNSGTLKGKSFSLVFWGTATKTGETDHILINLPSNTYNSASGAINDANNYTDYSINDGLRNVGFLIARATFSLNGPGNSWTLEELQDLRGSVPNTGAGSVGGALTVLLDDTTPQLGGDLDVNGNAIISVANNDINIIPAGTGNAVLGNYVMSVKDVVSAATDDYVLTYDNGTGEISLEEVPVQGDLGEFTVAALPAAASNANKYALATNASGGRTIVRSDGTNWKVVAVEGATVTT
jgi:hypothetical protein